MINKIIKSPGVQILKYYRVIYSLKYKKMSKLLGIDVMTALDTVKLIKSRHLSVGRFGDGEFNIMVSNKDIGFQKSDKRLAEDLWISLEPSEGYIATVPRGFVNTKPYKLSVSTFWWHYVVRNFNKLKRVFSSVEYVTFGDTNFTRTITELKNINESLEIIREIKTLWKGKNVLIIEGSRTHFGEGNDLLDDTADIYRIVAPAENAYSAIDNIVEFAIETAKNVDNLIVLVSLGPAATVIAKRLSNEGIWTIDIGHFDLQYEYYLRGKTHRVKVPGKYDNELGTSGVPMLTDAESSHGIVISDFSGEFLVAGEQ